MKLYLFIHSSSSWALRTGLTVGFDLGHMVMYDDTQSINQRIDMLHCRAYTHNAAQVQLESWYWNKVLSYIVCGWCVAAMWQGSIRALGWDLIDMSTWRDPNPFCISHFCGKKTKNICDLYVPCTKWEHAFYGFSLVDKLISIGLCTRASDFLRSSTRVTESIFESWTC